MKKVLSMILVLTMLLSVTSAVSFAAGEAEASAHELVIIEPGVIPDYSSATVLSLDEEITLDGTPSIKWLTTGTTSNQISMSTDADFSKYDTLHLTLYSPKATDDKIGIKFNLASGYSTLPILVDWEGWKTIDIPFANFDTLDKYTINCLEIWDQGWSYNYGDNQTDSDQNGSINIGKVWCTDESRVDIFDSQVSGVCKLRIANGKSVRFNAEEGIVYSELPEYLVVETSLDNNYLVRFHALTHVKDAETLTNRQHVYYIKKDNVFTKNGKNVVVIPTADITISGSDVTSALATDLLADVEFYFNGWGYEDYDSGDVISFENVYFTNNPGIVPEAAVVSTGDKIINSSKCVIDYENKLYGMPTNKWTFNGDNNFTITNTLGNLSEYNTLNLMLYSEKAVTDTIGVHMVVDGKHNTGKAITVDWEGWKKVEIPLSNYSGLNKANISGFYLANAGWTYGWDVPTNRVGNLNYMNIGKVWFSKNEANLPMENVVHEAEFNVNFVTLANQNLVGVGTLTFDFYCPAATENSYATVVFNNGTSNVQTQPIYLDFEGWKTISVNLNDVSKCENATIYFSAEWNLAISGYIPSTNDYGSKAKNVKAIYATKDCGEAQVSYVSESGYLPDDIYVETNVSDIAVAEVVVTEKESGNTVDATTVACGNKIAVDFEKEPGKVYNINLASIVDTSYNKYTYSFDYEVKDAPEGFCVEAKDLIVSEANVTATFDYSNFSGNTQDAVVVIAVYDALGKTLEATRIVNYDQLQTGRAGELYAELGGNYITKTVKAFALDSFESLKPLCSAN